MKVIFGLGNPGETYQRSRHNIGATIVRHLVDEAIWREITTAQALMASSQDASLLLVLPQTFMNRSGNTLSFIKKKYPQLVGEDLFVIHDDLDIPIGEFKIQFEKGPHVHNGCGLELMVVKVLETSLVKSMCYKPLLQMKKYC